MNKTINVLIGLNFLLLAGCSTNAPVTSSKVGSIQKEQTVTVKKGTVAAIKNVAIQGTSSRAGSTVGSVTGSILGSTVPVAGSIIGSLVGGALGGEAQKAAGKKAAYELTLQLETGERVIVTQLADTEFKVGDKIQLTTTGTTARVTKLQDNS